MPKKAWTYIWAIFLTGIALTAWSVTSFSLSVLSSQWLTLIILALLATLAQLFKAEAPDHQIYHTTLVFQFAGVILLHPFLFVFLILIPHLIEWVRERLIIVDSPHLGDWYLQPFNISIHIIIGLLARGVFVGLGTILADLGTISAPLAAIIAASVYVVFNHLLVGMALVLARGVRLRDSGILEFGNLLTDLVTLLMGYTVAVFWQINFWLILIALAPLVLIYRALTIPNLERQAQMDSKTEVWNAGFFKNALQGELARAQELHRPLTLVMADLDLLRNINNTYGHLAGDIVLQGIAKILRESAHSYDIVARFGGEEFAILLPETTAEQAHERIEVIRKTIEAAEFVVSTSDTPIKATMSFGVADRQGNGQTPSELVHSADIAVYQAKQNGRNCSYVYNYKRDINLKIPNASAEIPEAKAFTENSTKSNTPGIVPNPNEPVTIPQKSAKSQHISAKSRSAWKMNTYIGGITLFAIILAGILVRFNTDVDWSGLFAFTFLVVLVEVLAIDIYLGNTTVSTSAAPYLAGVLLFGPVAVIIIAPCIGLVVYFKQRSGISRLIFNTSNHAIGGLFTAGVIVLSGRPFTSWSIPIQIIISIAILEFVFFITTGLLAGAVSIDKNQRFQHIWTERFQWLAPYYLALGFVVYTLIFSYTVAGLMGLLAVIVPLLMLRFSQKQFIDHTEGLVNQLSTTNLELQNQAEEITLLNEELLLTLARSIDLRDPFVMEHSKNVARYAVFTAQELGLPQDQQEHIRKAGLLHDVGKLGIPETILFKPGSLTSEEYAIVREHVNIGAELIYGCHSLRMLIPFVKHHHERFDGEGYPDHLAGPDIPLEARILNLADAVEAMASDRPYKKAMSPESILEEITRKAGSQFDPEIVASFQRVVEKQGQSVIVNSARNVQDRDFVNFEISDPWS